MGDLGLEPSRRNIDLFYLTERNISIHLYIDFYYAASFFPISLPFLDQFPSWQCGTLTLIDKHYPIQPLPKTLSTPKPCPGDVSR